MRSKHSTQPDLCHFQSPPPKLVVERWQSLLLLRAEGPAADSYRKNIAARGRRALKHPCVCHTPEYCPRGSTETGN